MCYGQTINLFGRADLPVSGGNQKTIGYRTHLKPQFFLRVSDLKLFELYTPVGHVSLNDRKFVSYGTALGRTRAEAVRCVRRSAPDWTPGGGSRAPTYPIRPDPTTVTITFFQNSKKSRSGKLRIKEMIWWNGHLTGGSRLT